MNRGEWITVAVHILLALIGFLLYLGAVYPDGFEKEPAKAAPQIYP